MAIMTAAEARLYVRTISGSGEDSTLTTLISRADAAFAAAIGLPPPTAGGIPTLEDTAHTFYLTGDGSQSLRLPYLPVQSITSIHDSDNRDYTSADLVAASDYELFGLEGLVRLNDSSAHGYWSSVPRGIKAVAVVGWTSIPEDIKHAAGLQVAYWFKNRDHIGYTSVNQGGGTIQIQQMGLLSEVRHMLRPYRQPSTWVG